MVVEAERERLKLLLKDTITLLCKNGLAFKNTFTIDALIGVTLDDDSVVLMTINEHVQTERKVSTNIQDIGNVDSPLKSENCDPNTGSCEDQELFVPPSRKRQKLVTRNTKITGISSECENDEEPIEHKDEDNGMVNTCTYLMNQNNLHQPSQTNACMITECASRPDPGENGICKVSDIKQPKEEEDCTENIILIKQELDDDIYASCSQQPEYFHPSHSSFTGFDEALAPRTPPNMTTPELHDGLVSAGLEQGWASGGQANDIQTSTVASDAGETTQVCLEKHTKFLPGSFLKVGLYNHDNRCPALVRH